MDHKSEDYHLWLLLDRYLAGEVTGEEAEEVRDWLAGNPARTQILEDLRRVREAGGHRPSIRDVDSAWRDTARLLGIQGPQESSQIPARPRTPEFDYLHRPRRGIWAVTRAPWLAAALLLAIAGAGVLWRTQSVHRTASTATTPETPPRVVVTERGQRADLRLRDGTRVLLAPESQLLVPAAFDSLRREVTLVGEAAFEASHDSLKPFAVRALGTLVRDLGTRFTVRAYEGERSVRVVVTEGLVELRQADRPVAAAPELLRAGDLGRVGASGETTVLRSIDTTQYVAWTQGTVVFSRTPVVTALAELARWYDVDLRLADTTLVLARVSVTLHQQPLESVLDLFALSLGARIERRGRVIWLHRAPTQSGIR